MQATALLDRAQGEVPAKAAVIESADGEYSFVRYLPILRFDIIDTCPVMVKYHIIVVFRGQER